MPATQLNLAEQLAAISGAEHVRSDEGAVIVSPADTNQISEILRYADRNQLTVSPVGGATKKFWGNPVKAQIHLELRRLSRVLAHPWQDLTCTVQAGCTWQHLQQTLAQHSQFVALDPLWPERATVGGILATNDSGALRHRYGSLRDLVIGMTIVLADGTIARSGGRVVKNVAGYDLCKLLTGSLGTLAVISEATFRLHPLPQHTQTFTVSAPQAAQLAPLMASIRASQLLTQALQLRGDANGFHLDIQLNAHPESHQDKILQKMTEAAGLRLPPPIASQGENERGSGLQAAGKPALQKGFNAWPSNSLRTARARHFEDESAFTIKVTLLPSELATACERILELGGHCVAQANGILLASFPAPGHTTAYNINTLREEIEKHGGSLVVLKYAAPSWSELSSFGRPPDAFPLMQAIKQQFDPNKTLNPGRLLGGI